MKALSIFSFQRVAALARQRTVDTFGRKFLRFVHQCQQVKENRLILQRFELSANKDLAWEKSMKSRFIKLVLTGNGAEKAVFPKRHFLTC